MNFLDGYVRSPFAGIAPWILLAVVAGPGRFEEAASAALGVALLTLWVGKRRGVPVHLLEVFGVVFFLGLAIIGLVGTDDVIGWLEVWAGELSNIALAAFAVVTLLIGRPFTLAYAKDTTDREHWDSPVFLKINYVLSAVWAAAFLFNAAVGAYSAAMWGTDGDFWADWILPIGAILFAVAITDFYPDYATARFLRGIGEPTDPPPSLARIFDWLPPFIVVVGIVGWVTDALPDASGIVLIAAGVLGSAVLRKLDPDSAPKVTELQ